MDPNHRTTLVTVGTIVASILSAIAVHGEKALTAMAGVPKLFQAWADQMPLGAWSFMVALVLGTLLWLVAIVKLPQNNSQRQPHFSADTITLFVAVSITVSQQALAARSPGALLNALCMGLIAGLAAPYVGRGIRALFHSKPMS